MVVGICELFKPKTISSQVLTMLVSIFSIFDGALHTTTAAIGLAPNVWDSWEQAIINVGLVGRDVRNVGPDIELCQVNFRGE